MKEFTITFAYDIEAKDGEEAIEEFMRRIYDNDSISPPDHDDFIAKEKS